MGYAEHGTDTIAMIIREIIVAPEGEGERADRVIRRYLPELPEKSVRAAFLRRDVKLDGKRIEKDTRVRTGQAIRLYLGEDEIREPLEVVYEDGDVMLVNKPAGLSVERDERGGVTVTELCARHVLERLKGTEPSFLPAACHRLDNQTCGLCLFAKNEKTLGILEDVFRERRLDKTYECLVRGIPKPPAAECTAWLIKDPKLARVRVTDHPEEGSKRIITGYETLEAGPVSRLRVHLITGRTHQIRAHMAALGHPILGDDLYGDRRWNRERHCRTLRLCAVSMRIDTGGRLPALDGRLFCIRAPF